MTPYDIRGGESSFAPPPARVIVNADDFGYFDNVSAGIIDAARCGAITATGILTNSPAWPGRVEELRAYANVDLGVHLTLTSGTPLTTGTRGLVDPATGDFRAGKFGVARAVLSGRLRCEAVEVEWDAQISRCWKAGIEPVFLNSHEHVHMFPPLFEVVRRLAWKHGIDWVRWSSPEWFDTTGGAAWTRGASLQILTWMNRRAPRVGIPRLIGVNCSGKLDLPWLRKRLDTLRPGGVYELMCHPGMPADGGNVPASLRNYHHWAGELEALCEAQSLGFFDSPRVQLVRFRDLSVTPALS